MSPCLSLCRRIRCPSPVCAAPACWACLAVSLSLSLSLFLLSCPVLISPLPLLRWFLSSAPSHTPSCISAFTSLHPSLPSSLASAASAAAKETRQILADINAGSDKVHRKFFSSHRRDHSGHTLVPVTVLDPAPADDADRKGRKSTSSARPKLPKRSSSMRRAYHYFFGAPSAPHSPPAQDDAPRSPPAAATDAPSHENGSASSAARDAPATPPAATAAADDDDDGDNDHSSTSPVDGAAESRPHPHTVPEAPDPPAADSPEPPAAQLARTRAALARAEADLAEANRVVASQNDIVVSLEKESAEMRADFDEKEAHLLHEKKTLEDHLVFVVVQQVREAKELERAAVRDECEKEYAAKLVRPRALPMDPRPANARPGLDQRLARIRPRRLLDRHV